MSKKTYYEILEIPYDADDAEIRRAYRRVIKKHHPDQNPDDPKLAKRTRELNAARETLLDPETRQRYDEKLRSKGLFPEKKETQQNAASQKTEGADFEFQTNGEMDERPTPDAGFYTFSKTGKQRRSQSKAKQNWNSNRSKHAKRTGRDTWRVWKTFGSSRLIPLGVISGICLAILISRMIFDIDAMDIFSKINEPIAEKSTEKPAKTPNQSTRPENQNLPKTEHPLSNRTPTDEKEEAIEPISDVSEDTKRDLAAETLSRPKTELKKDVDEITSTENLNPSESSTPSIAVTPFDENVARQHQKRWAEYLGVEVEYANSIGIEFVLIPPGKYLMGAEDDAANTSQHPVEITEPFYIAKYETTQAEFEQVMDWNPSIWVGKGKGPWIDAIAEHARKELAEVDTSRYPIEHVSWLEALAFCDALSRLESNGETYRLPTEAEWEYACRAGTQTDFYWGNDPEDVDQYARVGLNSGSEPIRSSILQRILEDWSEGKPNWTFDHQPREVGTKLPNAWGMFDTIGNVGEWCNDWYEAYPTNPSIDPQGPKEGELKIIRGGDYWGDPARQTNVSGRNRFSPAGKANNTGFRLVREIPRTSKIDSVAKSRKPTVATFPFNPMEAKRLQQEWKRYLGLPQGNFINDLGMEFVLIPPGEFLMGIYKGARHQHPVRINRPFYISTTEVTQWEYRRMVKSNPSITAKAGNLPVNNVTWDEANNFCQKLCEGNEYKYRLPTEAEWTYVHRAGSYKRFWFGDNPIALKQDLNQYAINAHNSGRQITDVEAKYFSDPTLRNQKYRDYLKSIGCKPRYVKSKPTNPFGVYGMEGNVSEWCLDRFSTDYFRQSPLNDPRGPLQGTEYVLRGSNFLDVPRTFSPWRRWGQPASFKTDYVGFRVVVEIPEKYFEQAEQDSN